MQDNEENEEPVTVPQAIPGPSTKKFSKAEYSRNPVTQKAHLVKDFDIDLNSLDFDIQLIHIYMCSLNPILFFICYHYVILQSPLKMSKNETKKKYEVPERCRPPKPKEAPKDPTPSKPPPVFVQVGGLNPKEVFVSIGG